MGRAETLWIKEVQKGRITEAWKTQFTLFQDGAGVWRSGGRLGKSDLPYTRHPVLLPKNHYFSVLVVRRAHQHIAHSGVKDTLVEVRSSYWIPQGRAFVRQYIYCCVACRRYVASSYKPPRPPPLPEFRVQQSMPFSSVGVDYACPLVVKHNTYMSCQNGRRNTCTSCNGKVWVCLFTCCVTCAVHIDVVNDLSSLSFIRCFKRFISR